MQKLTKKKKKHSAHISRFKMLSLRERLSDNVMHHKNKHTITLSAERSDSFHRPRHLHNASRT